jgi:NAD(P)-dependent dehydrogenase (short-subunit alcohol dehydrogenase family)
MSIRFDGRVAIVTGAGGGLGRQHALALAARGATVVVNDFGRSAPGESLGAAEQVVREIEALGGTALANGASVTDVPGVAAMVDAAMQRYGRIDILVNNAGILRDKSFAKMDLADFRLVLDVHLMGAVNCTHAVWPIMRAQKYGRVVMTTSSSGLYGNFGQANYGAAKMALVGLMQTLAIEGAKDGIRVNCLAPTAATRMTEGLMPAPAQRMARVGAGTFERAYVTLTEGLHIGSGPDAAERVAAAFDAISDRSRESVPDSGSAQGSNEVGQAMRAG